MVEAFSSQRLILARQRRGLLKQELAARVGVSTTTMSVWENSKTPPSEQHVQLLARELDFPVDFFFGDAPPLLDRAAFRSLARMTAKQRHMALAAGSQAVQLDLWIESQFRRPEPDVPDLRDLDPESAAAAVRAAWGLGYKIIPNFIHTLEAHGVRVYSLVHDGSEIDAFSDWQGDKPFIFLNTTKTAERSRMDCAHELGHLVLHAHTAGGVTKQHEDEAQAFASSFLMPRAAFLASAPHRISLPAIIDAKQRWGVSALAYVHRLHRLGRLTDWQYQSLCIQIKSRYGKTEPGPERDRESSQVLAKVFAHNHDGRTVHRATLAKHLRMHARDLNEITFGLTLVSMIGGGQTSEQPEQNLGRLRLME